MKKMFSVVLALALTVALATSAMAFSQIGIQNDKVAVASVAGGTTFEAEWYDMATNQAAAVQQGNFGSNVNVKTGDVYKFSTNYLKVTLDTNEYADYAACIYLRNWAADAVNQMDADLNEVDNLNKGLVHTNGVDVLPIKWAREFNPSSTVEDVNKTDEDAANFGNSEMWKWFIDETYNGRATDDPVDDSQFRTNTDKLNYTTFITKTDLDWAGVTTIDVYLMAWYQQNMAAGSYQTSTITLEAFYE